MPRQRACFDLAAGGWCRVGDLKAARAGGQLLVVIASADLADKHLHSRTAAAFHRRFRHIELLKALPTFPTSFVLLSHSHLSSACPLPVLP